MMSYFALAAFKFSLEFGFQLAESDVSRCGFP